MKYLRNNIVGLFFLAVGMVFAAIYVFHVAKWLWYPNQIDYGEGYLWYINRLWFAGQWKWDLNTPPFIPLMYGVVYPLVCLPFIKLFGDTIVVGRAVEAMAMLISCALSYLTARRMTGRILYGAVAGLLPLTQPIIRDWSLQYRVDMLAVMFSLAGIWAFLRLKEDNWGTLYLSLGFFTLAMMTKISAVAGLLAVLIYQYLHDRLVFWWYARMVVALAVGYFILMQIFTGNWYVNHIILNNLTTTFLWHKQALFLNAVTLFQSLFPLLAGSIWYLSRQFDKKDFGVGPLFLLTAGAVGLFTSLRVGGYVNYYIEFIFATCICFALALPKIETLTRMIAAPVLMTAIIVALCWVSTLPVSALPFPNGDYADDVAAIQSIIADTEKPVITENPSLVVSMGKELYIEFFIMTNWTELGRWDDSAYRAEYQNGGFDYVILKTPLEDRELGDKHFTKEVVKAIQDNFELVYESPKPYSWYRHYVYQRRSG